MCLWVCTDSMIVCRLRMRSCLCVIVLAKLSVLRVVQFAELLLAVLTRQEDAAGGYFLRFTND